MILFLYRCWEGEEREGLHREIGCGVWGGMPPQDVHFQSRDVRKLSFCLLSLPGQEDVSVYSYSTSSGEGNKDRPGRLKMQSRRAVEGKARTASSPCIFRQLNDNRIAGFPGSVSHTSIRGPGESGSMRYSAGPARSAMQRRGKSLPSCVLALMLRENDWGDIWPALRLHAAPSASRLLPGGRRIHWIHYSRDTVSSRDFGRRVTA